MVKELKARFNLLKKYIRAIHEKKIKTYLFEFKQTNQTIILFTLT